MVKASTSSSFNVLRRLLFLCCGVLTGFLLPHLLRINHSDGVESVDDTVVQGFAASKPGGGNDDDAGALTVQQNALKGSSSSQVPSLRRHTGGTTYAAMNITQAIVSLWPRIVLLRCEGTNRILNSELP